MTDWVDIGVKVGVAVLAALTAWRAATRGRDLMEVSMLLKAANDAQGDDLEPARKILVKAANALTQDMRASRHSKRVVTDVVNDDKGWEDIPLSVAVELMKSGVHGPQPFV